MCQRSLYDLRNCMQPVTRKFILDETNERHVGALTPGLYKL